MKTTGKLNAGNIFHGIDGVMVITPETTPGEVKSFLRAHRCGMADCSCGRDYARLDQGQGWEDFYRCLGRNGERLDC